MRIENRGNGKTGGAEAVIVVHVDEGGKITRRSKDNLLGTCPLVRLTIDTARTALEAAVSSYAVRSCTTDVIRVCTNPLRSTDKL